jgi:hypothetical protein
VINRGDHQDLTLFTPPPLMHVPATLHTAHQANPKHARAPKLKSSNLSIVFPTWIFRDADECT